MSDLIFALSIFGFVFWTAALTQLLPRALAYGVAFAVNRTLGRAQLSIGALYLYPLAGRFVVQRILYVDNDVATSLAELVVVWRWWRRGRLITFEDADVDASATDLDERTGNNDGVVRKLLATILGIASNPERRTALLSITCTGLRVRVVNMRANYVLLGKLRDFVSGEADIEPFEPGAGAAALGRKTSLDHILEYTSLKVNKGALYCCDPGASPLMLASFDSAKVRYKHGRARSPHDLFRYSLHLKVTELRVSVADLETLKNAGVQDPLDVEAAGGLPGVRLPFGLSRARGRPKEELECFDVVRAKEATAVYVVDVAGPIVPLSNSEDDLPPELKCTVELRGATIVYFQKSISALQEIQERHFPRLFDLTRVAEEFQARLNRRMPKCFILDITAYAETEDTDGEPPPPLIRAPFKPRVGTWRSLELLGVDRGRADDDETTNDDEEKQSWQPPETEFAIRSEKAVVQVIIPYKMGDPLNVKANVPWLELTLNGVVNFPICVADALEVSHCIKFPKVWNDLHKARLVCTIINGEITYMADLIRAIDDIGFQIDTDFRKPEDVRYFVPNESVIVLKVVKGFSVRLAASRGNAWADVFKGITDEFGMAVLKGEEAELTVNLDAGTTYLPSVVHVHWGLFVPRPTLYLALPCPQPTIDPVSMADAEQEEAPKSTPSDGRTFAERVRALVDENNNVAEESSPTPTSKPRVSTHKRTKQSYEMLEQEHVLIQIAEVGGNVDVEGKAKTHTELFADGVNENSILVRISGIVLDVNPHHLQHVLNIVANLSAFVNHMLTAEEKQNLDQKRRALAYNIVEDRRVPSFEECVLLGSEGGISLATGAHHAGEKSPVPPAMDDFVNITLEVDGGLLMLHNLPNSLCSFTSHPSQVCSIDVGKVCFALTGNQKEVVSRFAPIPENAEFKLYAGQPKELRTNVLRRAQNKPLKETSLHRYPQVTISDFLLTRQVLVNKKLGAYHAFLDVSVGKVSGCIQEVAVIAVAGFAKSVNVRPQYEEAPVIEALVGIQTNQVRIGRTDILVLCGSQALTFEERVLRNSSSGSLTKSPSQAKQKKVARVYVGFLPSQVASIAQLRLRDGIRVCMANVASDEFLSRMAVTVPDLSVQLFTPWGGTSTRWIDEATLRAQVSHSSAIKAWRQVGIQAGRPVMHKAGVFENFVLHAVWESHPSLWSDSVHVLQRKRLENADRLTRHIPTLWEAAPWGGVNDARQPKPSVLDSYNAKWWEFLDLVDRRKRAPSNNHQSGMSLSSMRRDVVSVFILSHVTLSIGPEALELANFIATEIRSTATEKEGRSALGSPGDLIELWRDLAALCSQKEDNVRSRDEDRPSKVLGTTLHCNLHVTGASVVLICPFLAEDTMDRSRSQPVVLRDERVRAGFPSGIQMSYRWRSQHGATGSPVSDVSTSPNLPSYSFLLRQSAVLQIPLIEVQTSDRTVATIQETQGRLSDSITFRRKRRIGLDVSEETHRGNHRTFDFSVASVKCGTLASDLETLSELGRVFSIYGLMFRAVGLDLEATFKWYQERRDAACNSVFAVPFKVLCKLPADDIRLICFGRQSRFLRSQRFVPKFSGCEVVENAFFAADELENKLAEVSRRAKQIIAGSFDFGPSSFVSRSVSVTARIDEILVAVCEREALAIRGFEAEGQFEVVHDARFAVQEAPVARIGIASVHFALRDDVAELGMRTVSTVASYIRFAAAHIPTLSYEVIASESDDNGPVTPTRSHRQASMKKISSLEPSTVVSKSSSDEVNDTPKRSRYTVRSTTRFMLRRHVNESSQDNGASGWSSRARRRRRSIEDSPRGLTPVHSPSGLGSAPTPNEEAKSRPSTPRRPRITRGDNAANYATPTQSPKLTPLSTPVQTPARTPASSPELPSLSQQATPNVSGLKDVLHMYKSPRVEEVASARIHGKKGFVVRSIDRTSGLDDEIMPNDRPSTSSPVRRSSSGKKSSIRRRSSSGRVAEQGTILPSNSGQQSFSSSTAATIICSVNDVNVSYYRSETRDLFADRPTEAALVPDLAIQVSKLRASGVITPLSLCQSFVVTVDDASLRSGDDNANCVLEGSLASIVGMVSVSSGTLPSDPKRVVASTRVSEFQLSLRARDLRSVQSFAEKFKKDVSSLALSSLSTRKSLAAMMRATKLENLTRTSAPRLSFATLAGDVSVEKFKASLLGFHPGDKEMQIAYEVESMFGSLAALENSNVTLTVGGLIYGHGLVLSSPSWSDKEHKIGFPTLDIRGVQWAHTTELPTQINVITGPLVTSTSFQGLRNVLYTVSGLLAFQNRTPFDRDTWDESSTSSLMGEKRTTNDLYSAGSSVSDTPYARSPQQSAALNRSLMTWERTKAVRLEFGLKPMSIGLLSGGVMATFDSESISGTVVWNKQVTHGNQLQAATQIPQMTLKYSRVDQSALSSEEVLSEDASLLVATKDIRLDLLKSQHALNHNFVFRLKVRSINGHLRPWRLISDAAVWANEQDAVVKEFQAVNSDAAALARNFSRSNSALVKQQQQTEHRIITVGADINQAFLAVPLLESEDSENHRFRITASDVRYHMRLGNEFALPSRTNLAQLRSQFFGVLWEDNPFIHAQEFQVMFAIGASSGQKKAHIGALRGRCSTRSWTVCPRKDIVLAFIDAKGAPENRLPRLAPRGQPFSQGRRSSNRSPMPSQPAERYKVFESAEFMLLPSRGYIKGLDSKEHFSGKTSSFVDRSDTSNSEPGASELSIPTFSLAWLRSSDFDFDLFDVDFSGKDDEFPQAILRKTGNIFSELFGAVATSSAAESSGDLPGFANRPKPKREVMREWSALFRFGKSRYVARENVTGKLGARLEFYAENHAGFLASVSASGGEEAGLIQNSTVVTGIAPLLSLKIKPDLEKAMTQGLELNSVRFLQGYAPGSAPHTCVHIQRVHASLDVMTSLLVREWLKRDPAISTVGRDTSSDGSSSGANRNTAPWDSNSIVVLGQPARISRGKPMRKSPDAAVRIMLQLSQPDGRVGLLIQRIHCGFAVQRLRSTSIGYSTDVHIGVHQIESRADWEYLSCSFKLSRLLLRFEGERAMQEENICGFATIVNLFSFDFKRGDNDALQLKVEGVAGACRVPECDLAVQTTTVDASVSSSTANSLQRLLQLATRLAREAKRQIESIAITDARLHDIAFGDSSAPPLDMLLPRSRGDARALRARVRTSGASGRIRDESGRIMRAFTSASASLSGDRLIINLHGYKFQDASGAQFKFVAYDVHYKEQSGASYGSRGSDGPGSSSNSANAGGARSVLTRRQLRVTFELLEMGHFAADSNASNSVISMPNPNLDFTVVETGDTATVDLFTKFDREIVISSMVSHYDYLVNILKMYGESRVQVRSMFEQLEEPTPPPAQVNVFRPFGGRNVELKRFVLSPKLQPLGELTPDLNILQRVGLGRKEQIPAYMYDFVMLPVAKALQAATKPLL